MVNTTESTAVSLEGRIDSATDGDPSRCSEKGRRRNKSKRRKKKKTGRANVGSSGNVTKGKPRSESCEQIPAQKQCGQAPPGRFSKEIQQQHYHKLSKDFYQKFLEGRSRSAVEAIRKRQARMLSISRRNSRRRGSDNLCYMCRTYMATFICKRPRQAPAAKLASVSGNEGPLIDSHSQDSTTRTYPFLLCSTCSDWLAKENYLDRATLRPLNKERSRLITVQSTVDAKLRELSGSPFLSRWRLTRFQGILSGPVSRVDEPEDDEVGLKAYGEDDGVHWMSDDIKDRFFLAVIMANVEKLRVYLSTFADALDAVDDNGRTALVLAFMDVLPDVGSLLLHWEEEQEAAELERWERQKARERRKPRASSGAYPTASGATDDMNIIGPSSSSVATSYQRTFSRLPSKVTRILDLNAVDPVTGNSSLHFAALHDRDDMAAEILLAGANIDPRNNVGHTPLIVACHSGSLYAAEALLEAGADPDIADEFGATPLHIVAAAGDDEFVRLLLEYGAGLSTMDKAGMTAKEWAMEHGHVEVVEAIKEVE